MGHGWTQSWMPSLSHPIESSGWAKPYFWVPAGFSRALWGLASRPPTPSRVQVGSHTRVPNRFSTLDIFVRKIRLHPACCS